MSKPIIQLNEESVKSELKFEFPHFSSQRLGSKYGELKTMGLW